MIRKPSSLALANSDSKEIGDIPLPPPLQLFEQLTHSGHYHCGYFIAAEDSLDTALEQMVTQSIGPLRAAKSVLDIGCAMGGTAAILAAAGKQVVGIDPCGDSIVYASARARRARTSDSAAYLQARLEDLDQVQPNSCFDGIVMIEALQHFRELAIPLRAGLGRLRPAGTMVVSDVVLSSDLEWDHVPFHRPGALARMALEIGFATSRCRDVTRHVTPTFAQLVDRLQARGRSRAHPDSDARELLAQLRNLQTGFEDGDLHYEITVLEAPA